LAAIIFILALISAVFVPLASSLIDTQRANTEINELRTIYTAIVGDPKSITFGYLGDVGDYPSSLLDLVQSPGLAGWNGPYLNNARIDSGILYDQFGGAIEYFQPSPPAVPASPIDQLVLISKGLDRSSTNTASNPNLRANFSGTLPSSSSYATAVSNVDNIVYPVFTDNPSVLSYQSLGQVNFNLRDFDEAAPVNGIVQGCPGLYDIVITSVPRGTNEAYITYSPGGAGVDLLQGLYTVQVLVRGSALRIFQEQISVRPGAVLTRDYTLPGVNSILTGKVPLTVVNNTSQSFFAILADASSLAGVVPASSTVTVSVTPCALVQVETASVAGGGGGGGDDNNQDDNNQGDNNNQGGDDNNEGGGGNKKGGGTTITNFDFFMMPDLAITKTYSNGTPAMATLTVTNSGSNNTVAVYDAGLLVGTASRRGNRRVKTFSLKSGDSITVRNENNSILDTFTLSGSITKNY